MGIPRHLDEEGVFRTLTLAERLDEIRWKMYSRSVDEIQKHRQTENAKVANFHLKQAEEWVLAMNRFTELLNGDID